MGMKKTLVAILCLGLLPACGGSGGGDDGNSSNFVDACDAVGLARTKVANGEACSFGEDPGASPIVRLNLFSLEGTQVCTGAAIDSNVVLTAAHCVADNPFSIQVDTFEGSVSASSYLAQPGFAANPSSINPGSFLLVNDVALVFTSTPMTVSKAPILISREAQSGENAVVAGFGETSPGSGDSPINAGNATVTLVTTQHIGIEFEGGQAHPCQGDSGGPIMVQVGNTYAIAGVVSQSDPAIPIETICQPGDSTLYANLQNPSTLDFLVQHAPSAASI